MKITKKLSLVGISLAMVAVAVGAASYTNARVANAAYDYSDVLSQTQSKVTGTSYKAWSYTSSTSGVTYSANSAGDKGSVQLRSSNSNSGIVSTASKNLIRHVSVSWISDTADGRTLNVYGSNNAYSDPADLYTTKSGTLLGTIVKGTSTELTISDDYTYVGVRSASGAMYLGNVTFDWEKNSDPDLSLTASETSIYTNESITFTAERMNTTANIVWTVNDEPVTGTVDGNVSTYVFENKAAGNYTVKAALEGTTIYKTIDVEVNSVTFYDKVTDISKLTTGTNVVIGSADGTKVAKAYADGNNIPATGAKISGDYLIPGTDVSFYSVVKNADGTYSFKTSDGRYLYASGGTASNQLKARAEEATWNVSIASSGVATVVYSDSAVTRNTLRYNSSNDIFSCYASGQADVSFYVEHVENSTTPAEEAMGFATGFLTKFSTVCQADGSSNKASVTSAWNETATSFAALSTDAKNMIKACTETTEGDAGKAIALYNYIFAKYGAELSLTDYIWNKTPVARVNVTNSVVNSNNSLLIVVISSITLLGFAGFALKKKSK